MCIRYGNACMALPMVLLLGVVAVAMPSQLPLQTSDSESSFAGRTELKLGVGMDLTSSYGTVAVAYSNGTIENVAKVEGSKEYMGMMRRLSLDSSWHLTPPYTSYDEVLRDAPRQAERRARKSKGLPASEEVGLLAQMLSSLHTLAEDHLDHQVDAVLAATSDLVALYREDIEDAFEYLSLKSLDDPNYLFRPFREPSAVVASYGIGICHEPENETSCRDEIRKMPRTRILTILYTRNSLCLEVNNMASAYSYIPFPTYPTSMDFGLGSDAKHDNPSEQYYWEAVKDRITAALLEYVGGHTITKSFLFGESADDWWLRFWLEDTIVKVLGYLPDPHSDELLFAPARGAAEIARRGGRGVL